MKKAKAIELLKLAVPVKALTQQEYSDFVEAVNMGIDALEQPTTSDLISRQAVLDAINSWRGRFSEEYNEAIDDCENSIRKLPTVHPEVLACGNGELVAKPEPTDIDAKEAVYNLAEKIGIHQLFALTVELRGEPIQPELTYEQVEEYCKKRCLHVVTDDFFESTKPQRLGHWIKHIDPFDGEQYECSECGVLWEFNDGTPEDNEAYFCPNCGAKMTISTK